MVLALRLDRVDSLDAGGLHRREEVAVVQGVRVRRGVGATLGLLSRVPHHVLEALRFGGGPDTG